MYRLCPKMHPTRQKSVFSWRMAQKQGQSNAQSQRKCLPGGREEGHFVLKGACHNLPQRMLDLTYAVFCMGTAVHIHLMKLWSSKVGWGSWGGGVGVMFEKSAMHIHSSNHFTFHVGGEFDVST